MNARTYPRIALYMRANTLSLAASLLIVLSLGGCSSMHIPGYMPGAGASNSTPKLPYLTPQQAAAQRQALEQNPIYLILAAEMAGQAHDVSAAAKYYGAASVDSKDPALLRRTTEVALFAKNYQLVARASEQWLQVEPDSAKAAASLTIANIQLGKTKEADAALDRWIGDDKSSQSHIFAEIGEYLRSNAEDKVALDYAEHLAKRYPESVGAQIMLARLALKQQRPQSAITAARQAVALDENNRTAHELLIIAISESGDAESVIQALDDARKHFPNDLRFTTGLIEANIQAGRSHIAGKLLQDTLKRHIDDVEILRNLAVFALRLDRPVLAEKALKKLRKLPGQQDEAELLLGRLAMENGKPKQAIHHFRKVSPESTRYVEARIFLAAALADTAGLQSALTSLDKASSNTQAATLDVADLQRITLAKAGLLQSHDQFQQALDVLNTGLTRWPDANDIRLQRALVLFRLDRSAEAKQALREIIKSDPENAPALNALGFTLADENQSLDEAHSLIERALKLDPQNSAYIDSLGWYYYRKGELVKAEKALSRAFKMTPDAEIGAHLGVVLWHQDRHDEARKIWSRSQKINPDSEPLNKALKKFAPDMLKPEPQKK